MVRLRLDRGRQLQGANHTTIIFLEHNGTGFTPLLKRIFVDRLMPTDKNSHFRTLCKRETVTVANGSYDLNCLQHPRLSKWD